MGKIVIQEAKAVIQYVESYAIVHWKIINILSRFEVGLFSHVL